MTCRILSHDTIALICSLRIHYPLVGDIQQNRKPQPQHSHCFAASIHIHHLMSQLVLNSGSALPAGGQGVISVLMDSKIARTSSGQKPKAKAANRQMDLTSIKDENAVKLKRTSVYSTCFHEIVGGSVSIEGNQ